MGFLDTLAGVGAAFATGGASIYWQIAAVVTSFASKGPEQIGARVGDRTVSLDGEGQVLSRTWGRDRVELRLVYTSGLIEHKKSKTQGGLLGSSIGGSKVTTFTYGHNGVYLAGRGLITQPWRLKLNQFPIWDFKGGAQQGGTLTWNGQFWEGETRLKKDKKATKIRIYPGTLDQPVDPLLVKAKGPNQWTNYPGQVVVAIEVPDLTKYGNQAPRGSLEHEYNQTSLSDVIFEVAGWVGRGPEDFDLSALDGLTVAPTPGEGFTVNSRRSANSIMEELMDTYDFTLPEIDGVLVAVLNDQPRATVLTARDQRIHTIDNDTPDTALIEDDEETLPEIMEATFGDVNRENATGYRFARRQQLEFVAGADNGTSKKESFTLSGSYTGARVSRVCQVRLGKRWVGARKIALSWGLKHLYLSSGDRVGVESPLGDGEIFDVQLPKLDIPLFGATNCIAPLHDPLLFGLELGPEAEGLARPTPIEPGVVIIFVGEMPLVGGSDFYSSQKALVYGVTRPFLDSHYEGADVSVETRAAGADWEVRDQFDTDDEATIGELTADWTPASTTDLTSEGFNCQIWGGTLESAQPGAESTNLVLFSNGLLCTLQTLTQTAAPDGSRFYQIQTLRAGLYGSNDFAATLTAGTRFMLLKDASGEWASGPDWIKAPKMQPGDGLRLRIHENSSPDLPAIWEVADFEGENVRTPSPVVVATRDGGGLILVGSGRTRFFDDMDENGSPDSSTYREKEFSQGYKFQINLGCAGASASVIRYSQLDRAAFDFEFSAAELATLLNRTTEQIKADDIQVSLALHGEIALGRAATFAVSARSFSVSATDSAWTDSGVTLGALDSVRISATGNASHVAGQNCGPEGGSDGSVNGFAYGALLGVLMPDGAAPAGAQPGAFLVGESLDLSQATGRLYLRFNDFYFADNSGFYDVTLQVRRQQ